LNAYAVGAEGFSCVKTEKAGLNVGPILRLFFHNGIMYGASMKQIMGWEIDMSKGIIYKGIFNIKDQFGPINSMDACGVNLLYSQPQSVTARDTTKGYADIGHLPEKKDVCIFLI